MTSRDGEKRRLQTSELRYRNHTKTANVPTQHNREGADSDVQKLRNERDSLREQVTQLHRAKLAGDMLAGVAHDLNSALTGLVWCCEALQRRVQDDPDLATGLVDFAGGAHYARSLTHRLIQLGKHQPSPQAALRLQSVIRSTLELVEMLRPHNVAVHHQLCSPNARVWGNETQLQQVLLNLAANSFDAMRERGGDLTISLGPHPESVDASMLLLRLEDTGPGMSPSVMERAFEPFFTTKDTSVGTGLGLAVVRDIVQAHGGSVAVSSTQGAGTCVDVQLPVLSPKR